MSEVYGETYRGIRFHLTNTGYWFFDEVPKDGGFRRWSSYLTELEQSNLDVRIMRLAIDRHHRKTRSPFCGA